MIHKLSGIHETADYRTDTHICLYYNDENENYPPHWHIPFEIIMPVAGGYKVKCGGQSYTLREHDILIIASGVIHELFAPETGERIIFQPELPNLARKELNLLISLIRPAVLISPETYPDVHPRAVRLMYRIKEEYFHAATYYETIVYAYFLQMLVDIGRNYMASHTSGMVSSGSRQKDYMDKFLFITDYIDEHFAEDLTLEQVADLAGFSKYHFTRLFRQYTDTSFYKYLNQKRIDHAKTLLLDPSLSVLEVSLQSGFPSLSAFLRMFKQINMCTPSEFRNMYNS
mgnify:FL=1